MSASERTDLGGRAFHLIGVGGAGMSVLAQLLAERGAAVTGSDAVGGDAFDHLRSLGLTVVVGHCADNVPPRATVVVSTAIKETNPELAIARRRGQEVLHRSQALALAARGRDFVAVAGAHGKTTTSGMLAQALSVAGRDPSFAVGGVVRDLGTGAHLGAGRAFVAEADESDRSFLNYDPYLAVVTNVEPDHLDNYGTREAFERAFVDFALTVREGGRLIVCADDPGGLRLARAAVEHGVAVTTYGTAGPDVGDRGRLVGDAHVRVEITERRADGTSALLTLWSGETATGTGPVRPEDCTLTGSVPLELAAPGDHVVLDAAAAWAAGLELGVEPRVMARSLASFGGTGRRFETRGEAAGVVVIDDYAHHPTEIRASLAAAKNYPHKRIVVVFQPHTYTRTKAFLEDFADALSAADQVILADIYAAREQDIYGVSSLDIKKRLDAAGVDCLYFPSFEEIEDYLKKNSIDGDLLITMGAGNVVQIGEDLLR